MMEANIEVPGEKSEKICRVVHLTFGFINTRTHNSQPQKGINGCMNFVQFLSRRILHNQLKNNSYYVYFVKH